jgi:cell division protease FtsH
VFYGETAPAWGSHEARINISDETARAIDSEIKAMVEAGHKLARSTILKNKKRLEALAKALLEYETLTGDEVRAIVKGEKVKIARKSADKKSAIRRGSSLPLTVRAKAEG